MPPCDICNIEIVGYDWSLLNIYTADAVYRGMGMVCAKCVGKTRKEVATHSLRAAPVTLFTGESALVLAPVEMRPKEFYQWIKR